MIRIKPLPDDEKKCDCKGSLTAAGLVWQGLFVCRKYLCSNCGNVVLGSLPVNQSILERYDFYPGKGLIKDDNGEIAAINWYSSILFNISRPLPDAVSFRIKILKKNDKIIIVNTLDYIYGHSLLFLLNLQRIIASSTGYGIVVITQPMLEWLIPLDKVAEIWSVDLKFRDMVHFYPALSDRINEEINRFDEVFLSKGHVIPTNLNIHIEEFTGIKPFDFDKPPHDTRITFILREDPDRIWIRNILILKGFKYLKLSKLLLPIQYFRVRYLLSALRKNLGKEIRFTIAGLGKSFKFPSYIDDQRVTSFNPDAEKQLCRVYSESILSIGVHGSSMILPSSHSGMVVSLMPSKRWGNFAEDILFVENDLRLAVFQRRIVPLNLSINEIVDIASEMVNGRDYFIKKFIHGNEL